MGKISIEMDTQHHGPIRERRFDFASQEDCGRDSTIAFIFSCGRSKVNNMIELARSFGAKKSAQSIKKRKEALRSSGEEQRPRNGAAAAALKPLGTNAERRRAERRASTAARAAAAVGASASM